MTRSRFQDKVVFITGGASGIGAAAAQKFANEGAKIVIADISEQIAQELAGSLPTAIALRVDVTNAAAVEASFDAALTEYGRVDVVFNNAGLNQHHQEVHETDLGNWDRITGVNGDGFFYVLKFGIQAILKSGGGAVVNTASVAGIKAVPNMSPYTFAKAGVVGLTKAAALEYAGRNIRVNAVAPGSTLTPLMQSFAAAAADPVAHMERINTMNPLQGAIMPEDIADAVLFLASDEARKITGHTLPVEGGYTL